MRTSLIRSACAGLSIEFSIVCRMRQSAIDASPDSAPMSAA